MGVLKNADLKWNIEILTCNHKQLYTLIYTLMKCFRDEWRYISHFLCSTVIWLELKELICIDEIKNLHAFYSIGHQFITQV